MRLHRIAAAALALALGLSIGTPALAAETTAEATADARLAQITKIVKNVLSVSDSYTEFSGSQSETPLRTVWELSWSGDDKQLNVTATEEGKILSLYAEDKATRETTDPFDLHFPYLTQEQAQETAQTFLKKVFSPGEAAVFEETEGSLSLSNERAWLHGSIALNGIPSPLHFFVQVRLSDGQILNFYREDTSEYVGEVPTVAKPVNQRSAASKLKDTISLRLEYTRQDEETQAHLTYLPNASDDYYVDASNGELVNLTELREQLDNTTYADGGARSGSTADSVAESAISGATASQQQLTVAEQAGVDKLVGVLSQQELDTAARKWTQLDLTQYELASAAFSSDEEDDKVQARLTYTKKLEDGVYRRVVTLDARTGEVLSVYGSRPYLEDAAPVLDAEQAQTQAENFLKDVCPEQFAKTELYTGDSEETDSEKTDVREYSFQYAQKENGYFFPENNLYVQVDALDGSISRFWKNFDENVRFASADDIISAEKALTVWANSYPVPLNYVAVPVELDLLGEEARPLMDAGWSYYDTLKVGYAWGERDVWYSGVDAKTGNLVKETEKSNDSQITYSDISKHEAKQALTDLAEYGIGWQGGKAQPDRYLTQADCLRLLACANGYSVGPSEEDLNELYKYAINRGWLASEERDEDHICTRMEFTELLLDSMGYRSIAKLSGIYQCSFADTDSIPEDMLGYAALGQGLRILEGNNENKLLPNETITRAEAATILWKYLSR